MDPSCCEPVMSEKPADDHRANAGVYFYTGRLTIDPCRDLPLYSVWEPERHVVKGKSWLGKMWNRVTGAWSLLLRGDDYHE